MRELALLLVGVLATWRLTSLLHYEDGPYQIFEKLRRWAGAFQENAHEGRLALTSLCKSFLGGLLSCFWCLSVWMAGGVVILLLLFEPVPRWFAYWLLYVLACSTGAILLDEVRS